ncbi:MAG: alpha/beta hydrolase [bacterium]
MAVLQVNFLSKHLMMNTTVTVIIPTLASKDLQNPLEDVYRREKRFPVLYLLHGFLGDHSDWLRYTSIERYANEKGIAVVMPSAYNSFYTDMAHGIRCWSYISEELPLVMRSLFPLSERREDNFVAGLSMGGYGAMKWVLGRPDFFSAGASLSGALDIVELIESGDGISKPFHEDLFGDLTKVKGSENDLFYLAERLKGENKEIPRIYIACGTEDFLYSANLRFKEHLQRLGYNVTYEEGPGGHEWSFWDRYIRKVLDWVSID